MEQYEIDRRTGHHPNSTTQFSPKSEGVGQVHSRADRDDYGLHIYLSPHYGLRG